MVLFLVIMISVMAKTIQSAPTPAEPVNRLDPVRVELLGKDLEDSGRNPSWILDFYGNNAYLGAEDKQVFNKWIKKPLGKAVVGLKIDCKGYHNEGIYLLQGDYTNSKIPFKDAVREGTNEKEIDGWLEQMRPLVKEQVVFWALGKKRLLHADFNLGNIHIGAKTSQSGTSQEVHFDYPVKKARVLDFGYPGIFKVSHKATKEQVVHSQFGSISFMIFGADSYW
ncbi:hypothetical protein F5879DRAFT_997834 [Lentinula edodes]|nr:hypothetical protein F5879DRAFT_997834 [Lentinula edodes]